MQSAQRDEKDWAVRSSPTTMQSAQRDEKDWAVRSSPTTMQSAQRDEKDWAPAGRRFGPHGPMRSPAIRPCRATIRAARPDEEPGNQTLPGDDSGRTAR